MKKKDKNMPLIIISVPYTRNIRYLLCSSLFNILKNKYHLLIVSPFGRIELFSKEFGGKNVKFLNFDSNTSNLSPFFRRIFDLTEFLRLWGYRFKYRHKKMRCYWIEINSLLRCKNSGWVLLFKKIRVYFLGLLGSFEYVWQFLDILFGRGLFPNNCLQAYQKRYSRIILIQVANFGYQERYLANHSKKYKFKKIFLPYTTDQLICNGYLLSDYDLICVQGKLEEAYVRLYHNILSNKIVRMGMLWFRNVDELKDKIISGCIKDDKKKTILYAGGSSIHFPKETEFNSLNCILTAIKEDILPNSKIIYRPIINSQLELDDVYAQYAEEDLVEIKLPQIACYGVSEYPMHVTIEQQLLDYLGEVASTDLFVMSTGTSMCFDFVYFDVPVISNCIDVDGTLERSGFTATMQADVCHVFPAGSVTVYGAGDLIENIRQFLFTANKSELAKNKRNLLRKWDDNDGNYAEKFLEIVHALAVD